MTNKFHKQYPKDNKELFKLSNYRSWSNIEVLPFLIGREVDEVAMSYISGLRPSIVEIVGDDWCVHCDSRVWRVRVYTKQGKIDHITQEIQVGLYGDIENGHDLCMRLKGQRYNPDMIYFDERILADIKIKNL